MVKETKYPGICWPSFFAGRREVSSLQGKGESKSQQMLLAPMLAILALGKFQDLHRLAA